MKKASLFAAVVTICSLAAGCATVHKPTARTAVAPEPGASGPIQAQFELPEPEGPIETNSPGTDTRLFGAWEPMVATSPVDPRIVIAARGRTFRASFDGGETFGNTVTAPLPAGAASGGDPSVAFDSQGRMFTTYLCSLPSGGRDICVTGYTCNPNTQVCGQTPGIAWPVNVTAQSGFGGSNADKQWIAADSTPNSPNADNVYMVWSNLSTSPWSIRFTRSTDGGQTWSAAAQLSQNDESKVWPSHLTVGTDGRVYVAYHSQTGFFDGANQRSPDGVSGQIVLRRSDNGGAGFQPRRFPFPAGTADMSWNIQHKANGVIPGFRAWLQGSSQPYVMVDPNDPSRVYVVANDDPDNDVDNGDAADVFIVISDDFGNTWTAPSQVDSGPAGTFQIMPTAAIDPITGAITVTYYDNRSGQTNPATGDFLLDLRARTSLSGGVTWLPEIDVNDGQFDPGVATQCRFCGSDGGPANIACSSAMCTAPGTTRIGEYNGLAYGECTAHFMWADNPTSGTNTNTFYDNDPEAGGDFDPPDIVCPPHEQVGCNDSTDPSATGTATADDECDMDPTVVKVDQDKPGNCPPSGVIKTIERIWSAVDQAGNTDTCLQNVSVVDLDPPEIEVPDDLQIECNATGGVLKTDPQIQNWLDQASAVDECSDTEFTNTAPDLFPAGCDGSSNETLVIWSGQDECGNSDFGVATVTVVDTAAPAVNLSLPPEQILLPAVVPFTDLFQAVDTCGVVLEQMFWDDCLLFDGLTYGDADGVLSDELLTLDQDTLCAAVDRCGLPGFTNPVIRVDAHDCGSNTSSDTFVVPVVPQILAGLCD